MVCFYFTFNGVVSLVSLLAVNPLAKQDNLKPISEFLIQMGMIYRITGLWMGARGYRGIAYRESHSVRVLFVFCCSYAIFSAMNLLRLSVVCEEWPEVDCKNLKAVLAGSVGMEFFMFSYFAYILWSCMEKISSGVGDALPRFLLDSESLMTTGPISPPPQQRGSQAPIPAQIEPFTGQGHRLE